MTCVVPLVRPAGNSSLHPVVYVWQLSSTDVLVITSCFYCCCYIVFYRFQHHCRKQHWRNECQQRRRCCARRHCQVRTSVLLQHTRADNASNGEQCEYIESIDGRRRCDVEPACARSPQDPNDSRQLGTLCRAAVAFVLQYFYFVDSQYE